MNEIIYGIHAIQAVLKYNPDLFLNVYVIKKHNNYRLTILTQKIKQIGILIENVNPEYLDKNITHAKHQGIIAKVRKQKLFQEKNLPIFIKKLINPLLLILDGITDPHNLGACIRCADAAGVHAIILPRNRSAKLNNVVKHVASGAAEIIPLIYVTNLARTLCLLQNLNILIVGTDDKANHCLFKKNLTGAIALVIGSEGSGMRLLTRKYCDLIISIPMTGSVSSLNVSVATGICLFEILRQRNNN